MADVEDLSKRPFGYEALPISDRAPLKEEHIDDDNYAPKASKCRIFAGHVLRLCAIIGATYILTRSGRCLWNGCVSTKFNLCSLFGPWPSSLYNSADILLSSRVATLNLSMTMAP